MNFDFLGGACAILRFDIFEAEVFDSAISGLPSENRGRVPAFSMSFWGIFIFRKFA